MSQNNLRMTENGGEEIVGGAALRGEAGEAGEVEEMETVVEEAVVEEEVGVTG